MPGLLEAPALFMPSDSDFPRMGFVGSPVGEKNPSRLLGEYGQPALNRGPKSKRPLNGMRRTSFGGIFTSFLPTNANQERGERCPTKPYSSVS
jgi:hypothetical protein